MSCYMDSSDIFNKIHCIDYCKELVCTGVAG